MDQNEAPLLAALNDYHRLDRYGFTPPGHRQGAGVDEFTRDTLGTDVFRSDVLSSGGLDDRTSSGGYLAEAEKLMAAAVHADSAFFSTCGSSLSVKAAMMAVAGADGDLLLSRDAHKSVVAGLIFSGLRPRWIRPRWDTDLHLSHPPSPAEVAAAWERDPDAAGALIVSPSPYGTCADIAGIARECHARGKPLIVDEAWGAHLPFHPELPTWAMDAGADVCVVSVHKMGAGLEQGSVFHVQGDLVDAAHLSSCADLLMTTSPNVLIYAAMDGWRRHMVADGHRLLGRAIDLARAFRTQIEQLDGLHVLEQELIGREASHDLDPLQVLVDVTGLGLSGYQVSDWLREHCRLDIGMSDHRRVLFTLSMADDEKTTARGLAALRQLVAAAGDLPRPPQIRLPDPDELELESVLTPREAFFGRAEMVPAQAAAGRLAAEQLTPYPPGIPAVVPGERLNDAVIEYLRTGKAAGMVVPDATDSELATFRVLAEAG